MNTTTNIWTRIGLASLLGFSVLWAQDVILIDNGTSAGLGPGVESLAGTWLFRNESQHSGTWEQTGSHFANNNSDSRIRYSTQLPTSGLWAFEIWATNTLNHTTTATITHGDGTQSTGMPLNQGGMGGDASNQWLSLGIYDFTSTTETFSYTLNTSGTQQNTDAVRWVRMDANPFEATPIVVSSSAGISPSFYTETGTGWISSGTNDRKGVYNTLNRFTDVVGDFATYNAPLQAFQYEVKITWSEANNRSNNVLYEVLDANNVTHQFRIDQTISTVGDVFLGVNWHSLGSFDLDENSTVRIVMDQAAKDGGDFMNANGIQFIAIPEPGTLMLVGVALGSLLLFRRRK